MKSESFEYSYMDLNWLVLPNNDNYKTERLEFLKNIIKKFRIKPLKQEKQALDCLFSKVPKFVLKAINQIFYNSKQHIFIIEMKGYSDIIYNYTLEASIESGWRYYITGVKQINSKIIEEMQFLNNQKDIQKIIEENVDINEIEVRVIIDSPNFHCFELKVKDKRILLDCGLPYFPKSDNISELQNNNGNIENSFPNSDLEVSQLIAIRDYLEQNPPNWIIISHNHMDHTSGLIWIMKKAKKELSSIIGTKTTLTAYYSIIRKREKPKSIFRLKSRVVAFFEEIYIAPNCSITFLPAGHIPGSLSIFVKLYKDSQIKDQGEKEKIDSKKKKQRKKEVLWSFLYTSDFYITSIPPIDGFEKSIEFLPKTIDFAIIDGSRHDKEKIPFEKQLEDVYDFALKTWDKNGSVLIATNPFSHAIFFYMMFYLKDYERKDKSKNKSIYMPYIYVDSLIYDTFYKLSLFNDDLSADIHNMMNTLHNPFQSWRIQNIHHIRSTFESLARPSLILIHPTNVNKEPLARIFPLFSMNYRNLLVFGYFSDNDEKTSEGLFKRLIPLESYSDLNGILQEKHNLKFNPKCRIFNLEEEFRSYLFEIHPDKKMLEILDDKIEMKKKYLFHTNKVRILEKLDII
ncbi:MAG: MBL fold metallo-hydrolase [Promethearchaeota archaeon]